MWCSAPLNAASHLPCPARTRFGCSDLPTCLPGPLTPLPPLPAAYEFEEEKAGEEGDADLAKVEQLKALMGEQWAVSYGT